MDQKMSAELDHKLNVDLIQKPNFDLDSSLPTNPLVEESLGDDKLSIGV